MRGDTDLVELVGIPLKHALRWTWMSWTCSTTRWTRAASCPAFGWVSGG